MLICSLTKIGGVLIQTFMHTETNFRKSQETSMLYVQPFSLCVTLKTPCVESTLPPVKIRLTFFYIVSKNISLI